MACCGLRPAWEWPHPPTAARSNSSPRQTPPCTRPSARARTEPSGLRWQLPTFPAAGSLSAMGVLDDAIREHLELKRRRGADPTEIEQLEQEALGPVRSVAQERATDVAEYPEPESSLADEAPGHDLGPE